MSQLPTMNQLRWQCRRGMLELDLIFTMFLEDKFETLNEDLQSDFVRLLTHPDQDLQHWLFKQVIPPDESLVDIIKLITKTD